MLRLTMIIRDVGFGLLGILHALEFRLGLISPFEFDLLVVSSGDFENPTPGLLVSIPSQSHRFTKSLQKHWWSKNHDLSRQLLAHLGMRLLLTPEGKPEDSHPQQQLATCVFFPWLTGSLGLIAAWRRQQQFDWGNPVSLEFWWFFLICWDISTKLSCEERLIETSMGNLRVLPTRSSFRRW